MPKIKPIPVPGQNTISFVIEKDGSVSNCKVSTTYTDIKNTGKICEQVKDFVVPFDVKGEPVRKSVAISNVIIVKDLPDTADRGN